MDYTPRLRTRDAFFPCHGDRARFTPGVCGSFVRDCKVCGRRYEVEIEEVSLAKTGLRVLHATWTPVGFKTKKAERAAAARD